MQEPGIIAVLFRRNAKTIKPFERVRSGLQSIAPVLIGKRRIKSDYRYSKDIVYNNFPWPEATEEQKAKISQTAQAILDARALYPDASLAALYDELTMPSELRKAHQQNDIAVMQAYGMPIKETTESSCVAELMRRYQAMTKAESSKK